MQAYLSNPVLWIMTLLAMLAALFGARALAGYHRVAKDAKEDYGYKLTRDMIPQGLSQARYIEIYRRVNSPRPQAYIAAGLIAILAATPILFFVLEWTLRMIYHASGQNRVIEPGYLVWQFLIFFAVIALWVGIAYLTARRYHARAPGSLQAEMEDAIYDEA
jgi:hypothetical protein